MITSESKLQKLVAEWQRWSTSANQSEDGWQSGYPAWGEIMPLAAALMCQDRLVEDELRLVEFCWKISEEDEDMADYAKAGGARCWPTLVRLARSKAPEVRWQVFDVLGTLSEPAVDLLVSGLDDEDAYCRRRALLSLAKVSSTIAKQHAGRFVADDDPQMKSIAQQLLNSKLGAEG